MNKFMSKSDLSKHIKNGQTLGVPPRQTYEQLRKNGWTLEGDPLGAPVQERRLGEMTREEANQALAAPFKNLGKMSPYLKDVGQTAVNAVDEAASGVNEAVSNYKSGRQGFGSTALQVTGDLAGGAAKVISAPVAPVVDSIANLLRFTRPEGESPFNPFRGKEDQSPKLLEKFNSWATQHPEAAENLKSVLQIAELPLAISGTEQLVNATGKQVAKTGAANVSRVTNAAQKAEKFIDNAFPAPPTIPGSVPEPSTTIPNTRPQAIQQLVQPKLSASDLKKMAAKNPKLVQQGAEKAGFVKNSPGAAASDAEKNLAEVASSIKGFGDDVVAGKPLTPDQALNNAVKVNEQLSLETKALDDALEANNFAVPHKESIGTIKNALKKAAEEMGIDEGVYNAAAKKWEALRSQYPGNATGERQARIAFDDWAESKFGAKVFERGTSQADAVRTVRQASNGIIEKYAKANGLSYQSTLDRLSAFYEIQENLATHVTPEVFKSTVKRFFGKPLVKAAAKGSALATGASAAGLIP